MNRAARYFISFPKMSTGSLEKKSRNLELPIFLLVRAPMQDRRETRPHAPPGGFPSDKNTSVAGTSLTLGPTAGDPSGYTNSMRVDLQCAEDPYQASLQ